MKTEGAKEGLLAGIWQDGATSKSMCSKGKVPEALGTRRSNFSFSKLQDVDCKIEGIKLNVTPIKRNRLQYAWTIISIL